MPPGKTGQPELDCPQPAHNYGDNLPHSKCSVLIVDTDSERYVKKIALDILLLSNEILSCFWKQS